MRRALAVTTAFAALTLSACGGDDGSSASGGGSDRDRAQDGALKFAECMRDNGVDMPDPQVGDNGLIRIRPAEGAQSHAADSSNPKVRAAGERCRKHLEAGMGERTPKQRAEMRDAMVRFAECMREQGVDMPDPSADGGLVVRRGSSQDGIDPESPKFRAANEVCEKHLAAVSGGPSVEKSR